MNILHDLWCRVSQIAQARMQPLYDDPISEGYTVLENLSSAIDEYITERTWKFNWDVTIYTNPQVVTAETIAQMTDEQLTEALVAQRDLARKEMKVAYFLQYIYSLIFLIPNYNDATNKSCCSFPPLDYRNMNLV